MGGVVYASLLGLKMLGITSRLILCGAPIAVGVVVYAVLVVAFKCITRSDCLLLPKGAKIAKLLRL
jgi:stage V sporulation protein B